MTKAELVERVADKLQLTKKQPEAVVNMVLHYITEALSEGDKVELRGFGSFRIRRRNPHEGRNPQTGDTGQIPAKRVPFFQAGKSSARWLAYAYRQCKRYGATAPSGLPPLGSPGPPPGFARREDGV